jgi:hypothetical protein
MDSKSQGKGKDEAKSPREKSVTKAKRTRGMSAWACAAKARNWTLESSKDPSTHKANAKETCDAQPTNRTTDA